MNRLYCSVMVLGVAGAVATWPSAPPGLSAPSAPPGPAAKRYYSSPNPWSSDAVQTAQIAGNWRGEYQLHRGPNGHFHADVRVKGIDVRMVVDTGASIVALTGEDARRVGLVWNESEVATVGEGASGPVRGVLRTVDSVTVGGIIARDVQVMIVPEGLGVSLLGQNVLRQAARVEMRGDRMVLSNL